MIGRRQRKLRAWAVTVLAVAPVAAVANQGLMASQAEWLWPQLQARITVETASLAPVALTRPADFGSGSRAIRGGALLGDYVFATPGLGNFRATSGVMLGGTSGAPVLSLAPTSRLAVTVLDGGSAGYAGSPGALGGADSPSTVPYLGLGYSSAARWRSLSLSADIGLVAGRPAGLAGVGRSVFGAQGWETTMRDLRLAPVLQLGVRYSF